MCLVKHRDETFGSGGPTVKIMENGRGFGEVFFVIILFLIPLLRWSLLTILREGLLCIIDNRCDLVRHFLICLLCQAVLTKLREENKGEEGFKSILKRKLCILAAPYPINLISFVLYFSPGACVW